MSVTLHTPSTVFSWRHTPSWMMLAAAAGGVNAFAFLACNQYVTHLTGTVTRAGLGLLGDEVAWDCAVLVFWFIAGASASAFALQARAQRNKSPLWAWPLVVVAAFLAGTGVAGWCGAFGPVDNPTSPLVMLSLLAFSMGLQNAAVATTTGLFVRTTHLTGPAADLGVHLGTACFADGEERAAALKGAFLRACKISGFLAGAFTALYTTHWVGYLALLPPAGLVLAATALSFMPAWGPSDYGPVEEEEKPPTPAQPKVTPRPAAPQPSAP